jgi:hypothetical protein
VAEHGAGLYTQHALDPLDLAGCQLSFAVLTARQPRLAALAQHADEIGLRLARCLSQLSHGGAQALGCL